MKEVGEHRISRKVFGYELTDAWGLPISDIEVFEECEENQANCKYMTDCYGESKGKRISHEAVMEIRKIISEDRIYDINRLEIPPVLDGVINKLYFFDGKRSKEYVGYNIGDCISERQDYPNAVYIAEKVLAIKDILVKEGIEEKVFSLE